MSTNPYEPPQESSEPGEPLITPASQFPAWFQLAIITAIVGAVYALSAFLRKP